MITTTVIWPQTDGVRNPSVETGAMLDQRAAELSPGYNPERSTVLSTDGTEFVSIRSWPSEELAQAWVDYILANHPVTSAVVNL